MWQVNTAKQNIIFPEKHPYFTGCPPAILKEAFDYLPYERRYIAIHDGKKAGGKVFQHVDVITEERGNNPYKLHLKLAKEVADEGWQVKILPEIKDTEPEKRRAALPGIEGNSNPDLWISGKYFDVKNPEIPYGKNTLGHCIAEAADQAGNALINIEDTKITEFELWRIANGKILQKKALKSVWFRLPTGRIFKVPEKNEQA
jgi:hypothetical protein